MRPSQVRNVVAVIVSALVLFWAIPMLAGLVIDYNWWKEVGQVGTWMEMLWYSIAPVTVGTIVAFIALWLAHDRGLRFAGVRQRDFPLYSRVVPVGSRWWRSSSRRSPSTTGP